MRRRCFSAEKTLLTRLIVPCVGQDHQQFSWSKGIDAQARPQFCTAFRNLAFYAAGYQHTGVRNVRKDTGQRQVWMIGRFSITLRENLFSRCTPRVTLSTLPGLV